MPRKSSNVYITSRNGLRGGGRKETNQKWCIRDKMSGTFLQSCRWTRYTMLTQDINRLMGTRWVIGHYRVDRLYLPEPFLVPNQGWVDLWADAFFFTFFPIGSTLHRQVSVLATTLNCLSKNDGITGKTRQQQRFTFKLHVNSLLICKRINYNTRSMVELFLNYFVIQWEIHDIDQSPQLQIFSYFSNVMFANPKFVRLSGANPKCMTGRLSPVSKLMPHYPVKMRMWRTGGGKRCMLLWPLYTASNATRNICKIHSSP